MIRHQDKLLSSSIVVEYTLLITDDNVNIFVAESKCVKLYYFKTTISADFVCGGKS